jgi:hypothetical protein
MLTGMAVSAAIAVSATVIALGKCRQRLKRAGRNRLQIDRQSGYGQAGGPNKQMTAQLHGVSSGDRCEFTLAKLERTALPSNKFVSRRVRTRQRAFHTANIPEA